MSLRTTEVQSFLSIHRFALFEFPPSSLCMHRRVLYCCVLATAVWLLHNRLDLPALPVVFTTCYTVLRPARCPCLTSEEKSQSSFKWYVV